MQSVDCISINMVNKNHINNKDIFYCPRFIYSDNIYSRDYRKKINPIASIVCFHLKYLGRATADNIIKYKREGWLSLGFSYYSFRRNEYLMKLEKFEVIEDNNINEASIARINGQTFALSELLSYNVREAPIVLCFQPSEIYPIGKKLDKEINSFRRHNIKIMLNQ